MAEVKKSKRFGKNPEDMLVERLNQNIEFSNKATAFHGLDTYGYIMVGEKGIEYYNERTLQDYIQIPWEEVALIIAAVYFGGRYIPRIAIRTNYNGDFPFSVRQPRAFLRACRNHFPAEKIVRSLNFAQVIKQNFILLGNKLRRKG
ncbi:MAG: DUF956 family protein [Eubacteriales bacterium]